MTEATRGSDESSDPSARVPADTAEAASAGGVAAEADLTERVVNSRVLHRGRYLDFRVDTIERADGSRATRDIVGHPGAVAILAVDGADRVLLVRQYRVPAGAALLEIPAGTLDVDAATGAIEDPDGAARRELEEETGFRAGRWQKLASFWTAPGFATELMHLYLATELTPAHADRLGPDEDERLELEALPLADAVAKALDGGISDAKSIVGLLMLDRLRGTEAGAAAAAGGPPEPAVREPTTEPGAERLVHVRFVLTLADAIRSNIALASSSRSAWVFGILLLAAAVPPILNGDVIPAVALLAFATAILTGVFIVPFVWFQTRRRPEVFREPWELEVDARGLRFRTPLAAGVYPWSAFTRIRERSGFIYLESGMGVAQVIPVAALEGDAYDTFQRLARDAGFAGDGRRVGRPG